MSRLRAVAAGVALLALLAVPTAQAHQGNPNYRSVIDGISRNARRQLQVLNFDDRFELDNRSGKTVMIYGYQHEPYARMLADGTVEVNRNSPAYYLNDDRYAHVDGPAERDAEGARPSGRSSTSTGRFQWHDHRMHWMGKGTPPQVKDKGKRTKVFDWKVPMQVGAHEGRRSPARCSGAASRAAASRPARSSASSRSPSLGLGAVVVVRRRRGGSATPTSARSAHAGTEAW